MVPGEMKGLDMSSDTSSEAHARRGIPWEPPVRELRCDGEANCSGCGRHIRDGELWYWDNGFVHCQVCLDIEFPDPAIKKPWDEGIEDEPDDDGPEPMDTSPRTMESWARAYLDSEGASDPMDF